MKDPHKLLKARLQWEKDNPRPDTLRRAERAIVQGLVREGFGPQHQVTEHNGFEIVVEDLTITVSRIE